MAKLTDIQKLIMTKKEIVIQYEKLYDKYEKLRWISIKEIPHPPFKEGTTQSVWVDVTDGKNIVEALYYDYTQREYKPNYATGKGWHCHGMRKSSITHFRFRTLPES